MRVSYNSSAEMLTKNIAISLGANTDGYLDGCWGTPIATLCRSLRALEKSGVDIVACSRIYRTPPHPGAGLMSDFYNVVVEVKADFAVHSLLRHLKDLERRAGRRMKPRWSARPLDLDILDYGGRVMNWPASTRPGGPIVLPHPLMHRRGFVLVPLAEIDPHWCHPVLGVTAATLLARAPRLRRGITPA